MNYKTGDRVVLTTAKLDVFGTVKLVEPSGLIWIIWDGQPEFSQASGPYSAYELRMEAPESAVEATDALKFVRVQARYYKVLVDGVERPIVIVRDGRKWIVQYVNFTDRTAKLETQTEPLSNLQVARYKAGLVWQAMKTARALDHAEALELNAQVVYVEGHGTRAYILKEVYADGGYVVRPLSGGMEWGFDRRAFGTVPFVACGCEHARHENMVMLSCDMLTPKGVHTVAYVGTVCETCAVECHGSN